MKRPPQVRLLFESEVVIDGFAGGGGASTGIEMALGRSPDIAINHDREALTMHAINHPETRHIRSNIRTVSYRTVCKGRAVACGWFSPDCTYHSKARGGRPFRHRNKARRLRGLAWEVVRCAIEVRPRVLFMENVEELKDWCPLDKKGRPDWSRRGQSFRRWVARLENRGYVVEWRVLRASDFGAPTSRKRLFVIARCDGQPIVWPEATHGPKGIPYRTAAECLDFSLPVPSIFMNKRQASAWAKAHGLPANQAPHRPLATPTLRRIARGVMRYVVNAAEPFIVSNMTNNVPRSVHEPLSTVLTGNHKYVVAPVLASLRHHDESHAHSPNEPIRTIPASDREFALIAPVLVNTRNGERVGQAPRVHDITQPYGTVTAQGSQGAVVAAFLAKHLTGSVGVEIEKPLPTTVAAGVTHALTTVFLAKHNGGHEATGQEVSKPVDTLVCRENKALVTSHLVKLKGTSRDGQPVTVPLHTVQAHGNHYAEVRAFLFKYYGSKKDGKDLAGPIDTITTKDRFGLVTVTIAGEEYVIVDIGMRMLTPRELFRAQGFPESYQIDCVVKVGKTSKTLTKRAQTRLVGNSVPPHVAAALVRANMPESTKYAEEVA